VGHERITLGHRLLVGLALIVLVAVSGGIGLLVANWPQWARYLGVGR
jgi:hypothetical protein